MITTYPAIFYNGEDGYSVSFPDLPGALTCGRTLEEAMEMAIDCMAGYIFTSKLDNEFIPEPTPVDNINLLDYVDLEDGELLEKASVVMIAVDVEAYAKEHF
jgi:predicted RNase H-like HicB family nuclease